MLLLQWGEAGPGRSKINIELVGWLSLLVPGKASGELESLTGQVGDKKSWHQDWEVA